MSQISEYNYMKVRDLQESLIKYIEIRDNLGVKIVRIPITDPRVTHTFDRTKQEQTYTILISGSDTDITLPITIGGTALFETAISTDELSSETTTAFLLNATGDTCTITYKLQIPEVI